MKLNRWFVSCVLALGLTLSFSASADEPKKSGSENDLNKRVREALERMPKGKEGTPPVSTPTPAPEQPKEKPVVDAPLPQPDETKPLTSPKPLIVSTEKTPVTDNDPKKTPPAPKVSTYTIQSGDTLIRVAEKLYGDEGRWVAIAKANPLVDPVRLKVGQVLKLPDLAADVQRRREEAEKVKKGLTIPGGEAQFVMVEPGDTLSAISVRAYGKASKWRLIFDANRDQLEEPDALSVGMKLKVPPLPGVISQPTPETKGELKPETPTLTPPIKTVPVSP